MIEVDMGYLDLQMYFMKARMRAINVIYLVGTQVGCFIVACYQVIAP